MTPLIFSLDQAALGLLAEAMKKFGIEAESDAAMSEAWLVLKKASTAPRLDWTGSYPLNRALPEGGKLEDVRQTNRWKDLLKELFLVSFEVEAIVHTSGVLILATQSV